MNESIERREAGAIALFNIIGRMLLLPFVLLLALARCVCHVIVWAFDPTYNHRAALEVSYGFMRPR